MAFFRRNQLFGKTSYLEVNEAEIGIGNNKIKLKANLEDLQIGFKFWTELTTRKLGLPLDEEHDVIVEIYNSWYEFFGVAREMIKSVPVSKVVASESTNELVLITVHILNQELRPHLTRWQAQYRRCWESVIDDPIYKGVPPQQIQKNFYALQRVDGRNKRREQKACCLHGAAKKDGWDVSSVVAPRMIGFLLTQKCVFDNKMSCGRFCVITHICVLRANYEQSQITTYQAWTDPAPVGG